jgi:hypothetical protein
MACEQSVSVIMVYNCIRLKKLDEIIYYVLEHLNLQLESYHCSV